MTCLRLVVLVALLSVIATTSSANTIYSISMDTTQLVGHPDVPFSIFFVFTDGSGVGDGNNTATISNIAFGGGSALGGPVIFGGASGSLSAGITIADSSFLSVFAEPFAPGLQLTFSLELTSNDNVGGTPDRLTFSILDSSGVLLPTLSPFGDYFLGVDLVSTGPIFDVYGSDPSRALTIGNPLSMSAPTVTDINPVPEPSMTSLLGAVMAVFAFRRRKRPGRTEMVAKPPTS